MMSAASRLGWIRTLPGWLRLPRRTVRLRLTLLYGSLFLASGVGLLVLTNVLVRQATGDVSVALRSDNGSAPGLGVMVRPGELTEQPDSAVTHLLEAQAEEFRAAAEAQRAEERREERRQLLIQSGVALCVMAVASIGLGWFVAGRVLRPLRIITSTARDISATNLHRRLAMRGPDDELKELGDTFDALLSRLQKAFDAQRQFVANASHELRSPLARQRTLIEVALSDPGATVDSLRDTHERVLASEEQQERLIEALFTLARSERGLDRQEPLDLAIVVREVLLAVRPELDRQDLDVRTQLGSAPIVGDRALVERLVTNLVDNALRYNQANGNVEIATATRGGYTSLHVSNSGPLIPTAEVDGLFQPFRRLRADRLHHSDGHGLGLSIVQAIASAHAATVHAAARPDGGLDVEVRFPATGLEAARLSSQQQTNPNERAERVETRFRLKARASRHPPE